LLLCGVRVPVWFPENNPEPAPIKLVG
jgi:hypothetical protein